MTKETTAPTILKRRSDELQCNSIRNLKGDLTVDRNEKTSKSIASKASGLLRNPKTPAKVKSVAASALTQTPDKKRK